MSISRGHRAVMNMRRFQIFSHRPMEGDRLRHQRGEIDALTNELNKLVETVTKAANPAIQSNISALETEHRKLHYQVKTSNSKVDENLRRKILRRLCYDVQLSGKQSKLLQMMS